MIEKLHEDPRVARTKEILTQELMDQVARTPWERVTVAELCRQAGVHRATFYEHFEGKEDLLDRALARLFDTLVEGNLRDGRSIERAFEGLFRHAEEHRGFYAAALGREPALRSRLHRYLVDHAQGTLTGSADTPTAQQTLGAVFGAGAILSTLEWFLVESPGLSVTETAQGLAQRLLAVANEGRDRIRSSSPRG